MDNNVQKLMYLFEKTANIAATNW